MYIPEFWAGVLATVGVEFILCAGLIGYAMWRSRNDDNDNSGNE